MIRHLTMALMLMLLAATPARAEWTLRQSSGFAQTMFDAGKFQVLLECERGRGLELTVRDTTLSGADFDGLRGLMVWITLPDGRTARWPVDVVQEGPSVSGTVHVSDYQLEFFRQGQSFEIDSPLTRKVFAKGNMKGTGAARLAFKEQCGF